MTFTNISTDDAVKEFKKLSVDDQLAFLWYVYEGMGSSITPAAPGAASDDIASGLFKQVKEKSHEEQLQIQRDIAGKKDTQISREYGSLSENTKLLFWYLLAQGMEKETIIPMPEDYQIAEAGNSLLTAVKGMEYQEQITFLRNCVIEMGASAAPGSSI
ncbi:MAG: orange carotenoid protein N-terminal domain-containing protein [Oscillatoria sp. PMC 1068.18]|nr:orange carotenoid protein N-terminal domain-containing protein [Oscillatoria sp. PMC 1076.18]MEC4990616.1 orange carotenoid protein N-terminal domain-containing protein [Oscillatoria sp. PMC 1068.18]